MIKKLRYNYNYGDLVTLIFLWGLSPWRSPRRSQYITPLLQIFIHWAEYKMTTPRDCSDSYLALYERTTSPTDRQRLYCDATSEGGGGDRRTASNVAYLRLFASSVDLLPRFRVVYTPFLTGENLFTFFLLTSVTAATSCVTVIDVSYCIPYDTVRYLDICAKTDRNKTTSLVLHT